MSEPVLGVEESYRCLREDAGVVELARDFIRASGPEAAEYLQGQLSQDVLALDPGASALSLLLEPQGKVSAFLRVTRRSADEFLLDLDSGYGEAALARLARFKLRTKVELTRMAGWRCLAVRGPAAPRSFPGDSGTLDAGGPDATRWSRFDWPGLAGVDLLGPGPVPPPGLPVCDLGAYEVLRIESGLPRMGAELDETTIPAEAGLVEATASFTKGCYTGQELVARIDSRGGNVPRRLRGVRAEGPAGGQLAAGDGLWVGDAQAGRVTSTASSPRLGTVGLAYVHRRFDPPFIAMVQAPTGEPAGTAGGRGEVRVVALPFDSEA